MRLIDSTEAEEIIENSDLQIVTIQMVQYPDGYGSYELITIEEAGRRIKTLRIIKGGTTN